MEPAGLGAGELLDVGQECDDVMLDGALDGLDAIRVELDLFVADGSRGAFGHEPLGLHRVARGELDVEPGAVARSGRPEGGEIGGRVAGDHRRGTLRSVSERVKTRSPGEAEHLVRVTA